MDFEYSTWAAWQAVFPNIRANMCLFHLTESIGRKIKKLNLVQIYSADAEYRSMIRCLVALTFLPRIY